MCYNMPLGVGYMIKNDYYNYYEILFSLRKEYLKNQEMINKLLSYIKITNDYPNEYTSNLVFRTNNKNNIDSLLLIIKKRQSNIRQMLDSIYDSFVYSDPNLKSGNYLYTFHIAGNYVYLLDDSQDGRYLNTKVEIINQNEFIELYKQLIKNAMCKGRTFLSMEKESIYLSNNGIHLLYVDNNNYNNGVKLDYDGLEDTIITNNNSFLENLMQLKIDKSIIPNHFKNIINSNMDDYTYTIEGDCNKNEGFYTIKDNGKKLILKSEKTLTN